MLTVIQKCYEDVFARTTSDDWTRFEMYSWPQTWPNTSCGFGGISGQAFVTRQTVIIKDLDTYDVFVYHGGRFAYRVINSQKLYEYMCGRNMPGKTEASRKLGASCVRFK